MLVWILITTLLILLVWASRKPSDLPPGRWGLPVLGHIPLYTNNFGVMVNDLHKQYGDIFTWKIGGRVAVCFCDYKLIKSVFSKPECQGRPDFYTFYLFMYERTVGILFTDGKVWSEGRKFALHHLKDFGMGKNLMEDIIQYEAIALRNHYEDTVGKPVELALNLNVAIFNVIWKLVADERYEIDDERQIKLQELLNADFDTFQGGLILFNIFPFLMKIVPESLRKSLPCDKAFRKRMGVYREFFTEIVNKHKETLDPNNPRDYIDAYLVEKQKGSNFFRYDYDYLNLISSIGNIFGAGSETTSSTIRWLVALLAVHPQIQQKMQKEIDDIVSRDRLPALSDREWLPYTEAVLLEGQRFASLAPTGVWHATTEDFQIEEYRLPKGTLLMACAQVVHRDPQYWEKPDEFYPEHFLDDEGKRLIKKEGFLPFSLGRRQCLGENLAKMELFLFITSLFQKYFFSPPEGEEISIETDGIDPMFNFVKPYKVVLTPRDEMDEI